VFRSWLIAVALAGCGSSSYRIDGDIHRGALSADDADRHRSLVAAGEAAWARRADLAHTTAAIARWEAALRVKDDDWRTYARLAHAYFFLADAHLGFAAMNGGYPFDADSAVDRRAAARYRNALRRGYQVALRGMAARSRELEQRLRAGIDLETAIRVIRKDAAALLYWYVSNLAAYARAEGFGALFQNRNRIIACVGHMYAIDRAYDHGGADRLLGVYYAAAPAMVGGDLGKSRRHFEAAQAADPGFLMTAVFAAEFLARRNADRAAFQRHLEQVLAAPDGDPASAPENAAARKKAQQLLARIDRYFPPG
jgi:hypothetical protein